MTKTTNQSEFSQIVAKAIAGLPDFMKKEHTLGSMHIPVMDPLSIDQPLHGNHASEKYNLDLTIRTAQVLGLSSLTPDLDPHIDLSVGAVGISLTFEELVFRSDDFNLTGDYKLLFLRHKIEAHETLALKAKSVSLDLKFKLGFVDKIPELSPDNSECTIKSLDFDLDRHVVLENLASLFKDKIASALVGALEKRVAAILNHKLSETCKAHAELLEKLARLYEIKKKQGFDTDGDGINDTPRLLTGLDGVGQFPMPLFWQIPSVDTATAPNAPLSQIVEQARTGDLLLFAGSHDSSKRIRRMTQSRFSHVVVVVKEGGFTNHRACIWQATSSSHKGVLVNGEVRSGIQLNYLEEMVRDYLSEDAGAVICHRKLNISEDERKQLEGNFAGLKEFILKMDGKPYTNDMDGLYIMGLMEIKNANKDDFFCAGIVADAHMKLGMLNTSLFHYQYAPRDFSEAQKHLPFTRNDISFGQETVITDIN